MEVVFQHAVVKQQLHVMRLQLHRAMAAGTAGGNVAVLARLLFYEKAEVVGH